MILTAAQWQRSPCIMIIDDEKMSVRLMERVLASAHYDNLIATTDAAEAVDLARGSSPDLIMLDLHMPGFDGFDVLAGLRSVANADQFVPVLVLTGDLSPESRCRALSLGATDFLTKPFDSSELVLRIHNMLQTRLLHLSLQRQKTKLEETLSARDCELEEARLEVLERLALAAELRDRETGRHMRSVGELSAALALRLGVEPMMAEVIRRAAPLHDIGKIGVPDGTLLKRGPLSKQELVGMRDHTIIGARLLSGGSSILLQTAAEIARHHHEKWDGSGYPDRLSGTSIPLAARIVAVTDVYDAMMNERPYREAWTRAASRKLILEGRGTHFDPAVVDAFESIEGARARSDAA